MGQGVKSGPDRSPAYGAQMATYLRLPSAPSLVIQPRSKNQLAITRLVSDTGMPERTSAIPPERAFVVSVHLTPAAPRGCEIWVDDRHSRIADWPAGGIGIYDLESSPRKRNPGPVDWVHYHLPREAWDAFTDDAGTRRIDTLQCSHGRVDPVLHRLTQMILHSVDAPRSSSELFFDAFRLLFCTHVAQTYTPSFQPTARHRGGLAPWQRRRAAELLHGQLDGSLRLATLARECGLSVSHFARSFRRSFGTSAHRYQILQRVQKAKELMTRSQRSLSEVALDTGFGDQAALSRTFKAVVGRPPGQWRREAAYRSRSPHERDQGRDGPPSRSRSIQSDT